jgi:hypothetical protein
MYGAPDLFTLTDATSNVDDGADWASMCEEDERAAKATASRRTVLERRHASVIVDHKVRLKPDTTTELL